VIYTLHSESTSPYQLRRYRTLDGKIPYAMAILSWYFYRAAIKIRNKPIFFRHTLMQETIGDEPYEKKYALCLS